MDAYNASITATAVSVDVNHALEQRTAIQGRLNRLADLYEDGMIDRTEYRQKRDNLRAELAQLPEPEQAHEVVLPPKWREMYNELTKENKRIFWHENVKELRVYRDHRIEMIF